MESVSVYDFNNESSNVFDFSNLIYNDPVKKSNGHYVYVFRNINEETPQLAIDTPYLKACDKIFVRDNRAYLDLEIGQNEEKFFTFITELEDHNIAMIYRNSNRWFKQQIPLDVCDDYHKSFIRFGKKGVPKIRVKIPLIDDKVTIESVEKGERISVRLEFTGIKFLRQQFSSEWVASLIKKEDSEYDFGDNAEYNNDDILSTFDDPYKKTVIVDDNLNFSKKLNSNITSDVNIKETQFDINLRKVSQKLNDAMKKSKKSVKKKRKYTKRKKKTQKKINENVVVENLNNNIKEIDKIVEENDDLDINDQSENNEETILNNNVLENNDDDIIENELVTVDDDLLNTTIKNNEKIEEKKNISEIDTNSISSKKNKKKKNKRKKKRIVYGRRERII